MSSNKRTGDLLTDAANDARRNGMMNGDLVKTARRAEGSDLLPKFSFGVMNAEVLILRMADRIEALEAEAEAANAIIAQERSEVLNLRAENAWLQAWQNAAFLVHSNIDLDIEADPEARAALEGQSDE